MSSWRRPTGFAAAKGELSRRTGGTSQASPPAAGSTGRSPSMRGVALRARPCEPPRMPTPSPFLVREATERDLPSLARLGAHLARMHHRMDPHRFFVVPRMERGYAWWLGKERTNRKAVVLAAVRPGRGGEERVVALCLRAHRAARLELAPRRLRAGRRPFRPAALPAARPGRRAGGGPGGGPGEPGCAESDRPGRVEEPGGAGRLRAARLPADNGGDDERANGFRGAPPDRAAATFLGPGHAGAKLWRGDQQRWGQPTARFTRCRFRRNLAVTRASAGRLVFPPVAHFSSPTPLIPSDPQSSRPPAK